MMKKIIFILLFLTYFFIPKVISQVNLWDIPGGSFINEKGKVVLETDFEWVDDFQEGLARFCIDSSCIKTGYIDTTGRIISLKKGFLYQFNEELAPYYRKNKLTFINKMGKTEFVPKYKNYILGAPFALRGTPHFSEGLASVIIFKKNNPEWHNYIFIDKKGEKVFDENFLYADNYSEGLAFVIFLNGDRGYINKQGIQVIKLNKEESGANLSEGFAVISDTSNNEYFINKDGKKIGNHNFHSIESFSDGMARVGIDNKYGFIDTTEKIIIDPIYCNASDFSDGVASVSINRKTAGKGEYITFIIDKNGNRISPEFRNATILKFRNGLAYGAQQTDKFNCDINFYINKLGEIVWKDTICVDFNKEGGL